jgi:hypothetical protein
MRQVKRVGPAAVVLALAAPSSARAGMPSFKVNDVAMLRVESLSFFLMVFFLSAWLIKLLWNFLRGDFPALPRLTYAKALGLVTLWGPLFVLVLTMISGARELLTPGAWDKVGFTYKLAKDKGDTPAPQTPPPPPPQIVEGVTEKDRRQKLDNLRAALWEYTRTHGGKFPPDATAPGVAPEAWQVPGASGLRYVYVAGLSPSTNGGILVAEPEVFGAERLVLFANGTVCRMQSGEVAQLLTPGGKK